METITLIVDCVWLMTFLCSAFSFSLITRGRTATAWLGHARHTDSCCQRWEPLLDFDTAPPLMSVTQTSHHQTSRGSRNPAAKPSGEGRSLAFSTATDGIGANRNAIDCRI